jgi:hypothetical protein
MQMMQWQGTAANTIITRSNLKCNIECCQLSVSVGIKVEALSSFTLGTKVQVEACASWMFERRSKPIIQLYLSLFHE